MIKLRKATVNDAEKLLEWRNDLTARKNFFNQEAVTSIEHKRWLEGIIKNQSKHLFIIINELDKPIGQMRFDVVKDEAEVSITISSKCRGQGYGTEAIAHGSEYFFKNYPQIKKIIARIKEDNTSSIMAFLRAGFIEYKKDKNVISLFFKKNDYPSSVLY